MGSARRLRYIYLAYFSRPKADRPLYRLIRRTEPRRIVEIGLTSIERTLRIIGLAEDRLGGVRVEYTLIDDFEDARRGHGMWSLREVYRSLKRTRARIRLVPGSPHEALRRAANGLGGTDLILVSGAYGQESLAPAWFYVPRMLHSKSLVVIEKSGEPSALLPALAAEPVTRQTRLEHRFDVVPISQVTGLASQSARVRHRRAA